MRGGSPGEIEDGLGRLDVSDIKPGEDEEEVSLDGDLEASSGDGLEVSLDVDLEASDVDLG